MRTNEEMRIIAETILSQLGGFHFLFCTGSTVPTVTENGLLLHLAKNKSNANRLEVIYDEASDAYTMKFYRRIKYRKNFVIDTKDEDVELVHYVYCYGLAPTFERVTGLYTSVKREKIVSRTR